MLIGQYGHGTELEDAWSPFFAIRGFDVLFALLEFRNFKLFAAWNSGSSLHLPRLEDRLEIQLGFDQVFGDGRELRVAANSGMLDERKQSLEVSLLVVIDEDMVVTLGARQILSKK